MTRQIVPLPFPPSEYSTQYFNEVIRALNLHFRIIANPGPEVFDRIRLLNLPSSATGLSPGDVWHDTTDNTLKIVPSSANNLVKLVGASATAEGGDVGV